MEVFYYEQTVEKDSFAGQRADGGPVPGRPRLRRRCPGPR